MLSDRVVDDVGGDGIPTIQFNFDVHRVHKKIWS